MSRNFHCLAMLTVVLLSGNAAFGGLVDVTSFQFQTSGESGNELPFTGNGVLRANGTVNTNPSLGTTTGDWNHIQFAFGPFSSAPTSGFVTATGGSTPVTMTFNSSVVIGMDAWAGGPYGALANQPLMTGYLGTSGANTPFLTVGNLAPNSLYDVFLYGNNSGGGAGAVFYVNGLGGLSTNTPAGGAFSAYVPGTDYVEIDRVLTNSLGQLLVTALNPPGGIGIGIENGIQIAAVVPEPSSLILCGVGAIALLLAARRRRKA
jgi:hypothetical protein